MIDRLPIRHQDHENSSALDARAWRAASRPPTPPSPPQEVLYADNCYIAGNVDYVWGTGVAYFNKCEIRTVGRSGVIVQARYAAGAYGYVFVDSRITADAAATSNNLARIDASVSPGSHVAYIKCQRTNVSAVGWMLTAGAPTAALRFWEYQSTDAAGNALNTGGRLAGLTPITASQATMMRTPTVVLAGWQP